MNQLFAMLPRALFTMCRATEMHIRTCVHAVIIKMQSGICVYMYVCACILLAVCTCTRKSKYRKVVYGDVMTVNNGR